MAHSESELPQKEGSSDEKTSIWLQKIRELYERDGKLKDFKKEERCLKAYLSRLEEETRPEGRLSIFKPEIPHARGAQASSSRGITRVLITKDSR